MMNYISILRGINVGGHRKIKMEALKNMCSELNFSHIRTYIQSGNIIFQSKLTDSAEISNLIKKNVKTLFGFEVPVITITQNELEEIIFSNPFSENKSFDPSFFHVSFLSHSPSPHLVEQLNHLHLTNEQFELKNKVIYLYCPYGYSDSKLTNHFLEKKLNVVATTRNWKTANELLKIAKKAE